jgi:hypothetical protein
VLARKPDGSFALHPAGGSSSTKVFDGTSDGTNSYTLTATPQGTRLVWVDGLLETDYSVSSSTLTFGTAPSKGTRSSPGTSSGAASSPMTSASTSPASLKRARRSCSSSRRAPLRCL